MSKIYNNTNAKTQVIYVWNYVSWGGAQIYFFNLMKEAKKHYHVAALVPENSQQRIFDQLDELGIEYKLLPPRMDVGRANGVFEKLVTHTRWATSERQLVNTLTREFDLTDSIVHADLGFWQSFTSLLRLSLNTCVFVTIHTSLPRTSLWRSSIWKIKGGLLSRLSRFHMLASNEDAKRSLAPYIAASKFAEVRVAYSGIDTDEIEQISARQATRESVLTRYGLPVEKPLIVSLGQFVERKGCWIVLEALRKLKDRGTEFRFIWMGTAATDTLSQERIDRYRLGESFRLMTSDEIGSGRGDVLSLLDASDLFVLASLEEGLPIALVEAMALGKACIATRINAIPEAIEDRENGRLITAGSSDDLVESIEELLAQPALREQYGAKAKIKALTTFDAGVGAEITARCYAEALER